MEFFRAFLVIILLLLLQAFSEVSSVTEVTNSLATYEGTQGNQTVALNNERVQLHKINCKHACSGRCSKASKRKRCKRACKSCCQRCQCVPPGTFGHKDLCPCYARLKTHGNKPKCP